jgi:hypothetical protein
MERRERIDNEAVDLYEFGVEEFFSEKGAIRLDSSLGVGDPERPRPAPADGREGPAP